MAIKKCVAVRLGVVYDSQTTNTVVSRTPCENPRPLQSTPISPEYTKMPPGGYSYFLIEKSPETFFFKP
jgi:hypothetical protein